MTSDSKENNKNDNNELDKPIAKNNKELAADKNNHYEKLIDEYKLEIEGLNHKITDCKHEITNFKNQVEDLNGKLLRTAAESENIRRRYEKQLADTQNYAVSNFAKDMLSVIDNLSRALEHVPEELDKNMGNFVEGVQMTKMELLKTLNKHGVEPIAPEIGDKFDYNIHHAISQIQDSGKENGVILAIMQEGYKLQSRLLRPASVAVAKE